MTTASESKILNRLSQAAPTYWLRPHELRAGSGLTMRGFRIVTGKMEAADLIARDEKDGHSGFSLTFKGGREIGLTA
jgi:hypothetical protein